MTGQTQAPEPRENLAEQPDWVGGEGGPQFSQGGMGPGGSEMETWKKPPAEAPLSPEDPDTVRDQAERLAERLDND